MSLLPVIMAGGSGTRLWPLSRQLHPKQFLALGSGTQTMLQETVARMQGLDARQPVVICNEEHRFLAAEQMRQIGHEGARILLEPVGRNTAPAIALAALDAMARKPADAPAPLLLVLAADHLIRDAEAFRTAVRAAESLAQAGSLVTFGVVPDRPETGYGYIEQGTPCGESGHAVKRFVEKPDLATAQQYLQNGGYLWNSGMFLMRADRYLEELKLWAPDILHACQSAMAQPAADMSFVRVDRAAFEACRSDSIDYAVMEKTDAAVVVPLDAGWSDVGSWASLWDVSEKDSNGNVCHGDVLCMGSESNLAHASSRLVSLLGVRDLMVVETADAVLVAHKDHVQDVKKVVDQLKAAGRSEHHNHREVYRPWGSYDSIGQAERYQVKRITVKPGAKLSVQMHHHRAEHWIVVSGTARITNGDQTYLLTENQSTYIPVGQVHALENPGKIPLELIEVQSGSYLGEDDIVRFEDRYGRTDAPEEKSQS